MTEDQAKAYESINANELFRNGKIVQSLGVTAALCAYGAFIATNWDYFTPGKCLLFGIPVILAYLTLLSDLCFPAGWFSDSQKVLRWQYYTYILSDVIFLGILVWLTGGPRNSYATPLFLLIPTIAACYCHPKRKFFKCLIVAVLLTFVLVSFLEFMGWTPPVGSEVSGEEVKLPLTKGIYLINIFTILCILTAAYCYFATHDIRSNHCANHRRANDDPSGVNYTTPDDKIVTFCDKLYL